MVFTWCLVFCSVCGYVSDLNHCCCLCFCSDCRSLRIRKKERRKKRLVGWSTTGCGILAMASYSHLALPETLMPSSPTTSVSKTIMPSEPKMTAGNNLRPETPGALSSLSTTSSLSMRERQQRDSSLISGSVYLITSNGTTISLPIPSESRHDPLNWTEKKRWLAFFVVSLGVYTGVSPLQGASLTLNGIAIEFLKDVSNSRTDKFCHHADSF